MPRLENKTVLITGAARGIGRAIAELFQSEGAEVLLTDIRDEEGEALATVLGATYRTLDVRLEEHWRAFAEDLEERGQGLDVVVNNAGITGFLETSGPHDVEQVSTASWDEVMRVNATGVMLGCQYGIRLMKPRGGGSIVNLSSRSGVVGIPGAAAYAASKAAVRNHTKSVALHCAERGYGIRCNSLHPGAILTPMWEIMLGVGEARESMLRTVEAGIPLGHMGKPIDVAYAALYLASDESRYVTGSELHIDGGILAGAEARPDR